MTAARETLERRARELARPRAVEDQGATVDVVEFTIAGERYALDVRAVDAAFALRSLTPLPGASLPLVGVTSWRGAIVGVLDVRAAIGLPSGALNDLRMVLLLAERGVRAGILVDAITGVRRRRADEFNAGGGQAAPAIRGISRDAVTLVDGATIARQHGTGGTST